MCFAPQGRALFQHLNFQKCSEAEVLCTFWLGHVLHATTTRTFSKSQCPKVVRTCRFFFAFLLTNVLRVTTACTFSFLIWPHGYLFGPLEPRSIGKNKVNCDFSAFSRTCLFFLLTLSFSSLIFSLLLSSSLTLPTSAFPSVQIVGSWTSKLPSIPNQSTKVHEVWHHHFLLRATKHIPWQEGKRQRITYFCPMCQPHKDSQSIPRSHRCEMQMTLTPCHCGLQPAVLQATWLLFGG